MDFLSLPEDLYFYFPLELGSTCRKFNAKINIYNRNIVITGNPLVDYINYKKLRKIDLTKLNEREICIVLTRIQPAEIILENIEYLSSLCMKNLKIVEIKNKDYCGICLSYPKYKNILKKIIKKKCKIVINKAVDGSYTTKEMPTYKNIIVKKLYVSTFNTSNIIEKITVVDIVHGYKMLDNYNFKTFLDKNKNINILFTFQCLSDKFRLKKLLEKTKNFIKVKYDKSIKIDWLKNYVETGRISLTPIKDWEIYTKPDKVENLEDSEEYISESETESDILQDL